MDAPAHFLKRLCLGGIFLCLFLPLLQSNLHLKKWEKPLKGAYTEEKDTVLSTITWFDESFQKKKNAYLNQTFGLRNYYVRLNNQIDYTIFKKANAKHVVIGKLDFLYEDNYINAYFGRNFVGENRIQDNIDKLKQAQDILKGQGILLEIIFIPGKASFYPEYIPNEFVSAKKRSNYTAMCEHAKKKELRFLDFNAWFSQIKFTSLYDLYPRGGIHWSNYGALIAMDSLKKDIESNLGAKLNTFLIKEVNFTDSLIEPDNDIADALNLFKEVRPLPMPYATYDWLTEGTIKPKAVFIGDSYFWNWYYQGLTNNIFSEAKFWYYNQTIYPESEPIRGVDQLSFKDEVMKNQVIVLMATESNIQDIGWGFADKVIAELKGSANSKRKDIYIKYFRGEILKSSDWMEKVKQKSIANHITLEEMIGKDAEYLYETEYNAPEVVVQTENIKRKILASKEWLEHVRKKAIENKIDEAEMLELDAKYVYDTEIKGKK